MIELSFITRDSLNPNHPCGNPSQCEGFETTKRNRTHTVSPVLSLVLLPIEGSNRCNVTAIIIQSEGFSEIMVCVSLNAFWFHVRIEQ